MDNASPTQPAPFQPGPTFQPGTDQSQFIYRVVVVTLAIILIAVVAAMLRGLFDPQVDNKEIFTILGPGFQTVVGVFCGILGGRAIDRPTPRL